METPIEARVAAIVDDTTLVISAGYQEGVREGTLFVIFGEYEGIRDPETGADLGRWESVKARVVVTHVQQRMSTVRCPVVREERVTDGTRPLSAMMIEHSMGHYGDQADEWQKLDVRQADLSGRAQTQPIALGDGARSVPVTDAVPADSGAAGGDDAAEEAAKEAAKEAGGGESD
jgi:hypothetical protein